jgi:hypothetical protein
MNSNHGHRITYEGNATTDGNEEQKWDNAPKLIITDLCFYDHKSLQNLLVLYLKSAPELLSLRVHFGTSNEEKGEAKFKIGGDKRSTMRHNLALPLLGKHSCAHNLVIFQGSYLLSFEEVGRLIWRGVSRLDAFSSSPFPT